MTAKEPDVARAESTKEEAGKASIADQIMNRSQSARPEIEPFTLLAESLEWDLGQRYLRGRASSAFLKDTSPVPFIVNNDSLLSRRAAEVFFASLEESRGAEEKKGSG